MFDLIFFVIFTVLAVMNFGNYNRHNSEYERLLEQGDNGGRSYGLTLDVLFAASRRHLVMGSLCVLAAATEVIPISATVDLIASFIVLAGLIFAGFFWNPKRPV